VRAVGSVPAKALACACLLLALAASARGGEPAGDGSAACPESLDAWWSWRERQIAHLLEPLAYEGQTCLEIDGVAERARAIRELLEACEARAPETVATGQPVAALLENLGRFVRALSHQAYEESELGFAVPDRVYLEEVRDDIASPRPAQGAPPSSRSSTLAASRESQGTTALARVPNHAPPARTKKGLSSGCRKYPRETSPRLDAFARGSHVFEKVLAQSGSTVNSLPSLFTSKFPFVDRLIAVRPLGLVEQKVTLAER